MFWKRTGRRLILIGAGGQGRAVAEAARAARFRVLGFLDDEKQGKYILGSTAEAGRFARWAGFLLCVGDNAGRRALAKALGSLCYETLVHPTAWVSPAAALGEGTVVLPFAFVGPGAAVGKAKPNPPPVSCTGGFCAAARLLRRSSSARLSSCSSRA